MPQSDCRRYRAIAANARAVWIADRAGCLRLPAGDSLVRLRFSQSHAEYRPLLRVPFRAGAAHVVQLGPVAVADVESQVLNDAGEIGDCLGRVAGEHGPPRIGR